MEVQIHAFLTLLPDGCEWSASHSRHFFLGAHWIGIRVGPRAGVDVAARNRSPVVQLKASHCTNWASPVLFPPLNTILSHFHPPLILITYFRRIYFNVILPSSSRYWKCTFSKRPPSQNSVYIPYLSHPNYIHSQWYSPRFHCSNDTRWLT